MYGFWRTCGIRGRLLRTMNSENLPGQTCGSVLPQQQTEHGHFHRSDSACNAQLLRQTGLDGIYPEPTKVTVC